MNPAPDSAAVKAYLLNLQQTILEGVSTLETAPFQLDQWIRPEGGGGITRLVENGSLLERGGANFSHVTGAKLPPSASAHRPELAGRDMSGDFRVGVGVRPVCRASGGGRRQGRGRDRGGRQRERGAPAPEVLQRPAHDHCVKLPGVPRRKELPSHRGF